MRPLKKEDVVNVSVNSLGELNFVKELVPKEDLFAALAWAESELQNYLDSWQASTNPDGNYRSEAAINSLNSSIKVYREAFGEIVGKPKKVGAKDKIVAFWGGKKIDG